MQIRRLNGSERYEAYLSAVYCFHMRVEDPEAAREGSEADTKEDWGAFDENGKLMGRILNHKFDLYLDGETVRTGGIGGVATFPEYRDRGVVKNIFAELLPAAYEDGEVISLLYPFKHEFYRKQGYETVTAWNRYSFRPGLLCRYRFDGEVKKWEPGESVAEFLEVYNAFAPRFNLSLRRTEETMLAHMKVEKEYIDRKFSYVMKQNGKPIAYVIFRDVKNDPAAIMKADECAWTCREGFLAILGFLARFEADYGTIELLMPSGIDLLRIVESPLAYEIKKVPEQGMMVRVINAKKLLESIKKPADCDFTIQISDEIIRENNISLRVLPDRVEEVRSPEMSENAGDTVLPGKEVFASEQHRFEPADLILNVRTLGQLATGCLNLDEAMLRKDVTVNAKEELLRRVFIEKKIFVSEQF